MTDRIHLRGVEAFGYHGVLPDEKRDGQPFVVDVVMELDLARAGGTDHLDDTVSYADVAGEVVARITGPSFDLIERLAEVIAHDVLGHALVDAVTVTVHKPEAPVGHPFRDVAVEVHRPRGVPVVVALGANLGDARATLTSAVRAVGALPGMRVRAVSPLVETDPVGGPEQPAYLNAVLVGETTLAPDELLARLHAIEADHGRTREVRWGARTLDLDLVQVGMPGAASEVRSDRPELTLPHPRASDRGFVLVPWSQVEPAARLRVGADVRPVAELVAEVDTSGVRPGPDWRPTW
jgi:dihydroneopterin aldolase / 2-amino-4-hydroxy-6-hydroxymethyldihydropteridine diphosphokinase